MDRAGPIPLPPVLVAVDGRHDWEPLPGLDAGLLLRDTELMALIHRSTEPHPLLAVDLDSVAGLDGDEAAVDFLVQRLGIRVVLTRRPLLALRVAELGGLGLVHVLAFDSTGLNRSLEAHPGVPGVGTVISPGLVLSHLRPAELEWLPRPVLAYGLIDGPAAAEVVLHHADSLVVRPEAAARIAAAGGITRGSEGSGAGPWDGAPTSQNHR